MVCTQSLVCMPTILSWSAGVILKWSIPSMALPAHDTLAWENSAIKLPSGLYLMRSGTQAAFLTFALGGAKSYGGNGNMTQAHARLVREYGMTMEHFDVVLELIGASLIELEVPEVPPSPLCPRPSFPHTSWGGHACMHHLKGVKGALLGSLSSRSS